MYRYNLECTIRFHRPTQARIYISEQSMPLLRELVIPYMHSSMLYKIEAKLKVKPDKDTKILVTNLESGEITKFVTLMEAAKKFNVSHTTIANYIINNKYLLGKYSLKYNLSKDKGT